MTRPPAPHRRPSRRRAAEADRRERRHGGRRGRRAGQGTSTARVATTLRPATTRTSCPAFDAAKVTRSALQNAASIAALFLTTEAVVADKPEEKGAGGGMPGGGMEDFVRHPSFRRWADAHQRRAACSPAREAFVRDRRIVGRGQRSAASRRLATVPGRSSGRPRRGDGVAPSCLAAAEPPARIRRPPLV